MSVLGNGLSDANHHEDALSVREAELSMRRRLGASEDIILDSRRAILRLRMRSLDGLEEALQMKRDGYSGRLNLCGKNMKRPS